MMTCFLDESGDPRMKMLPRFVLGGVAMSEEVADGLDRVVRRVQPGFSGPDCAGSVRPLRRKDGRRRGSGYRASCDEIVRFCATLAPSELTWFGVVVDRGLLDGWTVGCRGIPIYALVLEEAVRLLDQAGVHDRGDDRLIVDRGQGALVQTIESRFRVTRRFALAGNPYRRFREVRFLRASESSGLQLADLFVHSVGRMLSIEPAAERIPLVALWTNEGASRPWIRHLGTDPRIRLRLASCFRLCRRWDEAA